MSWQSDLSKSNILFLNKVWNVISDSCGGGKIKPVEIMTDNDIAVDLDLLCGIDLWQTTTMGARGIASRVQFNCTKSWDTFTIRYKRDSGVKTEFEKRQIAISTGKYIYPYLTVQSYFDSSENLISCGVAQTKSIFEAIPGENKTIRKTGNASFIVVPFLNVKGVKIFNEI